MLRITDEQVEDYKEVVFETFGEHIETVQARKELGDLVCLIDLVNQYLQKPNIPKP